MHVDSADVDMPTQVVRSNMLLLGHMLVAEETSTMSAQGKLEYPGSTVLAANRCEQRDNGRFCWEKQAHRAKLAWPRTSISALCMTANARCLGDVVASRSWHTVIAIEVLSWDNV